MGFLKKTGKWAGTGFAVVSLVSGAWNATVDENPNDKSWGNRFGTESVKAAGNIISGAFNLVVDAANDPENLKKLEQGADRAIEAGKQTGASIAIGVDSAIYGDEKPEPSEP